MEHLLSRIPVAYSDAKINSTLKNASPGGDSYTRHFTQREEFMLKVQRVLRVGSCPIHHNVQEKRPGPEYLAYLREVMTQLAGMLPSVFSGLTHVFDPADIFHPAFIKLYKLEDQEYLYQVRLSLQPKLGEHTITERGSNDRTASYETSSIILEADFIPLDGVDIRSGKIHGFLIEQSISETWVGETGRGYLVQGIWLDRDLTRFFSKLLTPPSVRTYPYFPFTCRYRAVCHSLLSLDETSRQRSLPLLHKARSFLLPHLREIEESLRGDTGDVEKNPSFVNLKGAVPRFWADVWKDFSLRVYLNENDKKEFEIEHGII